MTIGILLSGSMIHFSTTSHRAVPAYDPFELESEIDILGEELTKVSGYQWKDFHPRLLDLSSRVERVRSQIKSVGMLSHIEEKIKKAEALLKAKTLQYFDEQIEELTKECSTIKASHCFSKCVMQIFSLRSRIDQGIKNTALSEWEKKAVTES